MKDVARRGCLASAFILSTNCAGDAQVILDPEVAIYELIIESLDVPDPESLLVRTDLLRSDGQLSPELIQGLNQLGYHVEDDDGVSRSDFITEVTFSKLWKRGEGVYEIEAYASTRTPGGFFTGYSNHMRYRVRCAGAECDVETLDITHSDYLPPGIFDTIEGDGTD